MIRIVAVGKVKNRHLAALAAEYLKRCGGMAACQVVEIKDADPQREAQAMLRKLGSTGGSEVVVAMDETGDRIDSRRLADFLGAHGSIAFLIGGADGLGDAARERARRSLRLSALTLPHELARVLLLEQIYRGLCINRNRPYHRG